MNRALLEALEGAHRVFDVTAVNQAVNLDELIGRGRELGFELILSFDNEGILRVSRVVQVIEEMLDVHEVRVGPVFPVSALII